MRGIKSEISKRYRQQCLGKQRHKSKGAAEAHARALARRGDPELGVYPCGFGNHWHVGHEPKRAGKTND